MRENINIKRKYEEMLSSGSEPLTPAFKQPSISSSRPCEEAEKVLSANDDHEGIDDATCGEERNETKIVDDKL